MVHRKAGWAALEILARQMEGRTGESRPCMPDKGSELIFSLNNWKPRRFS